MSHLVLKKKGSGFQSYDKKKHKFVGKTFKNKRVGEKMNKARDKREDKK